ncbi:MAG: dynamin family protein [Treponema sp.]|nr:dynamin family protein [Treponema sp.]
MSTKTEFSGFASYKQLIIELTNNLKQLKTYSQKMKLDENTKAIDDVLNRIMADSFNVAIVGEFKRGKSTVINALIGKDVLPTDVLPTTATLNKITYGITPFVTVEYKDGRMEEVAIDKLNDYVTKLTEESEERAKTVKEAVVHYPVNYCRNGVTIIDTPGLNDDDAMTEVTMSVLPQADAALMVIMAQSPFSESERSFLESRIITSDIGRVLFVVTGIDLLNEEDVDKVLENIRSRIQEHIMKKAETTFGINSKEFETYKRKIGQVRVYGLSAKKALKAKIKGDENLLAQSGFPDFETALERFLTEERGAITLSVPVNRVKTSCMEIAKSVQLKENALVMKKDDFESKFDEAMKEIETIRRDRLAEYNMIDENAKNIFYELQPSIREFWNELERAAFTAIDEFPMSDDDFKEGNRIDTEHRLSRVVSNAITKAGQIEVERIQEKITQALGKESARVAGFEQHFCLSADKIQSMFISEPVSSAATVTEMTTTAILNVHSIGLGSIFAGYKHAGMKGALITGAAGLAGISFFLALPITGPAAFLISVVVGGIAGTFGGKTLVELLFPKKNAVTGKSFDVRESAKIHVKKELEKMRARNDFCEKVREQIERTYSGIKTQIEAETNRVITDTESQLTQLKIDKAANTLFGEKEKEEISDMLNEIDSICVNAEKIEKQLSAVLSKTEK